MKKLKVLTVIFLVFTLLILSAGCSAASSASKSNESVTYGAATEDKVAAAPRAAAGNSATSTTASSPSPNVNQAAASRKIIRSADLTLETTAYDKAVSDLEKLTAETGGFVQSSQSEGEADTTAAQSRSASYTVRVPSSKLDSFINGVGGLGRVVSKSIKGEDVTQNYFDTETRLKTLKDEQTRVEDILNKTTNLNDIFTIEERLTSIQQQIEELTGELQKWDSLVDLSTVTIQIREVTKLKPKDNNAGTQITQALGNSLQALGTTLWAIFIVLLYILPFAAVFGLIAFAIIFIISRRNKSKAREQREDHPNPPQMKE